MSTSAPRLLVLGWHTTSSTAAFPVRSGSGSSGFTGQLRLLSRIANVVTLDHAVDAITHRLPLPPRAVALTFDDGYRDSLHQIAPALERHGMSGAFFLVPDFLDGRRAWWEDLAHAFRTAGAHRVHWEGEDLEMRSDAERQRAHDHVLDDLKRCTHRQREEAVARLVDELSPTTPPPDDLFLDWDEAARLANRGHIIGSHTRAHTILAREDDETQSVEIAAARSELESRLQVHVDHLAYPNGQRGDYDGATMEHVRRAGYRSAITTRPGLASPSQSSLEVRRVIIDAGTDIPTLFRRLVHGAAKRLRGRRHVPA